MAGRAPRPTGKPSAKAGARRPVSSQRKTGPKAAASPATPQRGPRATNRLVILLLVIGALVISFGSSLRAYLRQSDQIHQLQAQIAAAQESIAQSKEQQERWKDPSYIEQQARLRFGWVMPGQTPYIVLGTNGQPLNTNSELDAQPPTVTNVPEAWWSKEASSLEAADNPPPAVKKPTPLKRISGN